MLGTHKTGRGRFTRASVENIKMGGDFTIHTEEAEEKQREREYIMREDEIRKKMLGAGKPILFIRCICYNSYNRDRVTDIWFLCHVEVETRVDGMFIDSKEFIQLFECRKIKLFLLGRTRAEVDIMRAISNREEELGVRGLQILLKDRCGQAELVRKECSYG